MKDFKMDLAELLKPLRQMGWHWTEDGKMVPGHTSVTEDTPWISHNLDFDCYLWNRVFHHTAAQQRMTHTHCQTCFKVVVAPRNFLELIELEKWQERTELRCKAGVELREYVNRLYGGYFYSWEPGELEDTRLQNEESGQIVELRVINDAQAIDKGKQKYDLVRAGMWDVAEAYCKNWPDAPDLNDRMPVILKRGCTEFERNCGPTDSPAYRNISDEQIDLEKLIEDHVEYDSGLFVAQQPDILKHHIRQRWCEFAHDRGDMTYVQWLGHSLSRPPVTYHEDE